MKPSSWFVNKRFEAGFTLVEILTVMVIIGILTSMSIASYQSTQQKSRDTRRKSDLKQIVNALEIYYNDKGTYPTDSSGLIEGCNGGSICNWGDVFQDENNTIYMIQLPEDPRSNQNYYYSSPDGTSFQLYARLENTLDKDVPKNGSDQPQVYNGLDCGSYECNYGMSSPNISVSQGRSLVVE